MTSIQKYTLIGIIILGISVFFILSETKPEIPPAIGDPLELIVVKNMNDFDSEFFFILKDFLTIDIGPSPQPETTLKIMEISQTLDLLWGLNQLRLLTLVVLLK